MPIYTYTTSTSSVYSSGYFYTSSPYYTQKFSISSRTRYIFSQKELNTVLKAFAEDDYTWSDGTEITEDTYPEYFSGTYIIIFNDKTIRVICSELRI